MKKHKRRKKEGKMRGEKGDREKEEGNGGYGSPDGSRKMRKK